MIAPHDVTATRTALEWLAQGSDRSICISLYSDGWYVTAVVDERAHTASNDSLALAIREAIRGTR